MKLVECVPNFSEGREGRVLGALKECFQGENLSLLDFTSDKDHNRSVATVVGEPTAVAEAVLRAAATAAQHIDMRTHTGEHPALGATDVVPYVPIFGMGQDEAVVLAAQTAEGIAVSCGIPTYLYALAARRPQCANLADIREGGFCKLSERMKTLDYLPDFGPMRPHPTAGATVVGVRSYLIAYNVNLDTTDVGVAKRIATRIRERDGGLRAVKALGMRLADCAQVSMNLTDYSATPPSKVFAAVERLAREYGVGVRGGEVVGLMPRAALVGVKNSELGLEYDLEDVILENRIPSAWLK